MKHLILSAAFAALTLNGAVHAQVGVVTAVVTGKVASNLIDELRLAGSTLLDQANQTGNALIARAGNEANILAGNLEIALKEDLNTAFDRLSEERRLLIVQAEDTRLSLVKLADAAYSFKDSTALDLNAIATSLPFVKERFFVQSIRGLAYLPQQADYRLQLAASTLGIQEDVATKVQVFKGHGDSKRLLDGVIIDQTRQRFFADASIPNRHLAAEGKEAELSIVPMTLRFEVDRKLPWYKLGGHRVDTYDVPIFLSLFPRTAATVTLRTRQPTYAWVAAGNKASQYETPNRHCDKKCGGERTRGPNSIMFAVTGGAAPYKVGYTKLTNPTYRCVGGNCAFSDSFDIRLTENDTRLLFSWSTWSTPGTWEASADLMEYRVVGEAAVAAPPAPAFFGRLVELVAPKDTTLGILTVKTFTKQEYEVALGTPDPQGILTYQSQSAAGPDAIRVIYRVNDPSAVSSSKSF